MVTLVEFMPTTDCPLIKMPDIYEIMQMYARKKGLQVGQVFDCGTKQMKNKLLHLFETVKVCFFVY